jgi:hypothetical protein
MKTLKKDIHTLSKKYIKVNPLDINENSLSSLVLYSILRDPYCKDRFLYINLYNGIDDDYILYHKDLVGIYGVTNQTVRNAHILFNTNSYETGPLIEREFLTEDNKNYLKKIKVIFEKNLDDFENLIKELNLNTKKEEYGYLIKFLRKISGKDHEDTFMSILKEVINLDMTEAEYELYSQKNKYKDYGKNFYKQEMTEFERTYEIVDKYCKEKFHRKEYEILISKLRQKNSESSIKDPEELSEYKSKCLKKDKKSLLEYFQDSDEEYLDYRLNTLRNNKILYNNSFIKVYDLLENDFNNPNLIKNIMSLSGLQRAEFKKAIIEINNLLKFKSIEYLLKEYEKPINLIKEQIYKKHPEFKESPKGIQRKLEIFDADKTTDDIFERYTKNVDYLDLHYKNGYYTSIVTPIISGIAEIGYYRDHNYKHDNETFYILKNKFETEMFSCIKKNRNIESNYESLNNISVDIIDSFNCVHNIEEYSENIKSFFNKMIEDRKDLCDVIKIECLDSPKFTENQIQKLYNIIREVIRDNPDTIIFEELSNRTIVGGYDLTKAKKEVLEKLNSKEITKSDVLKIFKLMTYDNKEFKDILETDDYSERKEKIISFISEKIATCKEKKTLKIKV